MDTVVDVLLFLAAVLRLLSIAAPLLVLFFLGLNRSWKLFRRGGRLGIVGGAISLIFYPVGVLLTGALLFELLFVPTTFAPQTQSGFDFDVLLTVITGCLIEGVGYFIQSLFQRWTRVDLPTS